MSRLHALLAGLLLAGCASIGGGDADAVRLTVTPGTVSPGDSLVVVLENGSTERLGYNLCSSGLEQRSGETWQAVPSDRVCTMELRILEPGGEARFAYELPALPAGEYRAVAGVERMEAGSRLSLASAPFRVQE